MRGQWIGSYEGTTSGIAVLELDDMGNDFRGCVAAYPTDMPKVPPVFANVSIQKGHARQFGIELDLMVVDPQTAVPVKWEQIANRYPGVTFAPKLVTDWQLSDDQTNVNVSWKTDNPDTNGRATFRLANSNRPSGLIPEADVSTWAAFKEFAVTLEPNRYIFRGQESKSWRLRSHFHRMNRFNLNRFINEDIHLLHGNLSNLTTHLFNLNDNLQNAAFYSLVQHHGYPTPLLDWTHSPFIGAFFAYRTLRQQQRIQGENVRIFVFDRKQWQSDVNQWNILSPAPPHFSLLHPLAINNPRLVPQQAVLSITSVDDVEDLILHYANLNKKTYLRAIDLPSTERPVVMQELKLMGITAGSMFPGLDGACEQLKEQMFDL